MNDETPGGNAGGFDLGTAIAVEAVSGVGLHDREEPPLTDS